VLVDDATWQATSPQVLIEPYKPSPEPTNNGMPTTLHSSLGIATPVPTTTPSSTTVPPTRGEPSCESSGLVTDPSYQGLTEANAASIAQRRGQILRVVERDGHSLAVNSDRRSNRVDAVVANGTVLLACHE